jgi:hypothetical protein
MDDLELPDPSDPTEEATRTRFSVLPAWPFTPWETAALVLLYASPFIMRWLATCEWCRVW